MHVVPLQKYNTPELISITCIWRVMDTVIFVQIRPSWAAIVGGLTARFHTFMYWKLSSTCDWWLLIFIGIVLYFIRKDKGLIISCFPLSFCLLLLLDIFVVRLIRKASAAQLVCIVIPHCISPGTWMDIFVKLMQILWPQIVPNTRQSSSALKQLDSSHR